MTELDYSSVLVTGVPLERGIPQHIEEDDDTAFTIFNRAGKVEEVHTPKDQPVVRIHELMHARHTNRRRFDRQFKGVRDPVAQLTEDVRLHGMHWPWRAHDTPHSVRRAVNDYHVKEIAMLDAALEKKPEFRGKWPDFATRFRAAIVKGALNGNFATALHQAGFADDSQRMLASQALTLIWSKKEGQAGRLIEAAFFPPPPFSEEKGDGKRTGKKTQPYDGFKQPHMEIIELPLTEVIKDAVVGTRLATSGSRIYRPALRRLVLPQRMFIKKTPMEPGGTILVDASGSMGSWDEISKWCETAPFGTVAYYAGGGHSGKLFIYAKNGKKAKDIVDPRMGGNVVDGPALTWLMSQPGPRTFVTDRVFCGASDSHAQIVRLGMLERSGQVTVVDYAHDR